MAKPGATLTSWNGFSPCLLLLGIYLPIILGLLVKDGVPLLAGGLEALNGDSHFYQALGNIFTQFSDAYEGYLRKEKEINSLGEEAAYVMGTDEVWSKMETANIEDSDNGISFINQINYFRYEDPNKWVS